MRLMTATGRVVGGGLLVLLLVPILTAWPSALIDRGPGGSIRVSALPLALTLLDPFVWACARNSLLLASATALGSAFIGVGLGSIAGLGRFRGRTTLWALALVPLAAGPILIAPALDAAIAGRGGWVWLGGRSVFGSGFGLEALARMLAVVWVGICGGAPMVALATTAGLRKVDPAWSDAAVAVGATRLRAWLDLVWPNLRPGVARASVAVFTLSLLEPVRPLVFGVQRTLVVQLIRAATRLDQPTRAATLALLTAAIALAVWAAVVGFAGPSRTRAGHPLPPISASPLAAWASRWILLAWCVATTGPVASWFWEGLRAARLARMNRLPEWLDHPDVSAWTMNSALSAGLAVGIDLIILRTLLVRPGHRIAPSIRTACRAFEMVPPMAVAAWALAVPWILLGLADSADRPLGPMLGQVGLELSPGRSPGLLLVFVLAAGQLPMLAEVAARTRRRIKASRVDASRLMGEADRRAARAGEPGWPGVVSPADAFLAFALAATSVAPALLLTPFSERRTIAPAFLALVLRPGPVDPKALGLAVLILGLNLGALAWARSRAIDDSTDDAPPSDSEKGRR